MDALYRAICEAPEDDAPRLVWADREGGDRGELVVLQCALAKQHLPHPDRLRMAARVHELLTKYGRAWDPLAGLSNASLGDAFVRGFVEYAYVDVLVLEARAAELFERAPLVRSLGLGGLTMEANEYVGPTPDRVWAEAEAHLARAFAALPAGAITALDGQAVVLLSGDWSSPITTFRYGNAFVKLVADAPSLANLRALRVSDSAVDEAAIPSLARLHALEWLDVSPRFESFARALGDDRGRGHPLLQKAKEARQAT